MATANMPVWSLAASGSGSLLLNSKWFLPVVVVPSESYDCMMIVPALAGAPGANKFNNAT